MFSLKGFNLLFGQFSIYFPDGFSEILIIMFETLFEAFQGPLKDTGRKGTGIQTGSRQRLSRPIASGQP